MAHADESIPIERGSRVDDPGTDPSTLQAVVDYRGDVTIERAGGEPLAGYVFDFVTTQTPAIRLLPDDGGPAQTVPLSEVVSIEITGRDTAAGKSFDRWIKRYAEKKLRGEAANIESESLD